MRVFLNTYETIWLPLEVSESQLPGSLLVSQNLDNIWSVVAMDLHFTQYTFVYCVYCSYIIY